LGYFGGDVPDEAVADCSLLRGGREGPGEIIYEFCVLFPNKTATMTTTMTPTTTTTTTCKKKNIIIFKHTHSAPNP
jgi:hypothetical protein